MTESAEPVGRPSTVPQAEARRVLEDLPIRLVYTDGSTENGEAIEMVVHIEDGAWTLRPSKENKDETGPVRSYHYAPGRAFLPAPPAQHASADAARVAAARALVTVRKRTGKPIPEDVRALAADRH